MINKNKQLARQGALLSLGFLFGLGGLYLLSIPFDIKQNVSPFETILYFKDLIDLIGFIGVIFSWYIFYKCGELNGKKTTKNN